MEAKHAPMAFSFIFPSRTIDVELGTQDEAKITMRYFKALVQSARAKALKQLMGDDEDDSFGPPSPIGGPRAGGFHLDTKTTATTTCDTDDSYLGSNNGELTTSTSAGGNSYYSATL